MISTTTVATDSAEGTAPVEHWRSILRDESLPQPEKHRRLMQSGLTGEAARNILIPSIKQELRMTEADLEQRRTELKNQQCLVRSLDLYRDWEHDETTHFVLERNENTRAHRLQESAEAGLIFDAEQEKFAEPRSTSPMFSGSKVFVVKHDWASAFENSDMDGAEFRLPFEMCLFEFRVTGRTVIVFTWDCDNIALPRGHTVFLEGVDGVWLTFPQKAVEQLSEFLWRHIRAICVALDAQVAERTLVRAPHALNAKRAKNGKPPLRDFHVVDLSRRLRADRRSESSGESGRKVRLHFRRGHWRHYETHKTWINWMLVGNPDLGFIDKHYRI